MAFADFIGLRCVAPGVTQLTIRPALLNGVGLMLGPVGFALVDFALWEQCSAGETIATMNVSLNFIDSADTGEICCRSSLDRRNRHAAALSSQVHHEDGRLLITAVGSFAIRRVKRA
jgi:acyl-coenzyme A thioesterase PaaI-like protein